jgi:putative chitinase
MAEFDAALLRQIVPPASGSQAGAQSAIIDAIGPLLQQTLTQYAIDPSFRAAHFLAQTAHESANFATTVEYGNAAYFARYDGRVDLGNTQPGDGPRYRGRGLIQITGRANYANIGRRLGIDLVDDPDRAAEPATSLGIACEYWTMRNINPFCDQDDELAVTWLVNGGFNGLDDRRALLAKAKEALDISDLPPDAPRPTLQIGSRGASVAGLQYRLHEIGTLAPSDSNDGDFGPRTAAAVSEVQQRRGMTADGVVAASTWAVLLTG